MPETLRIQGFFKLFARKEYKIYYIDNGINFSLSLLLNAVSYFSYAKLSITHLKHLYHLKLEKFEKLYFVLHKNRVL